MIGPSILFGMALAVAGMAAADTVRVATYSVELGRGGPGLLLRDIGRASDPQILAVVQVIQAVRPDILCLSQIDDDAAGRSLAALAGLLRQGPSAIDYPYSFRAPVNAGVPSGFDLDGDGRIGWSDAFGYGRFPGNGGMAVLSRYPIDAGATRSFQLLRWADLPGARLPQRRDGSPYPTPEAQAALRLSSKSHWDVAVSLPGGRLHLLVSNPTPPLYDGAEAMNHKRNHDEIAFWQRYVDGQAFRDDQDRSAAVAPEPLVVLGNLNADPLDGAGLHDGIAGLLADPRLQDPRPASPGAAAAAQAQGGANRRHAGDPALDTTDWRDDPGPGNLRVDFALPSADLTVAAAGVWWPAPGDPAAAVAAAASDHRTVWVDLNIP